MDYTRSSDASDPSKRGAAIDPIFTVTSIINVGGNVSSYPHGRGPQGDVVRICNFLRLVRDT
ncbi:hypothetical protein [Archaeoglobus fulgidus]|uniref:hypothetical protein n=1 Tax=Archaeoglobus fulgidus TaxID=2234 RepID=UPI001178BAAB|nr:hypothetical protein [Archaeoglobus fulgidus]